MESYDVLRVFGLVVAWAIPAVLIVALLVFVILAPAFTSAGAVLRLYEAVRTKLLRRAPAQKQLPIEMPAVQEAGAVYDEPSKVTEKPAAEKELIEISS